MSSQKKMETCCDDLVDACQAENLDDCCDALKELGTCCDKEAQPKKHGAAAPADLDACEKKLMAAMAPKTQAGPAKTAAPKAGFAIPPGVWAFLLQAGLALLQELKDRRQNNP